MNDLNLQPEPKKRRVLIIEDEVAIVDLLIIHLDDMHCDITKAYDGLEGLEKARSEMFDLIILDLMLPTMDGIEICTTLRKEKNFTPIFMLSAKSEKYDELLGLEYGADAYMTKPFRIGSFITQVQNLLCRPKSTPPKEGDLLERKILKFGDLKLDINKKEVTVSDQKIELSCKEFEILSLLIETPGKSYTRSEILQLTWGNQIKGYEHIVNTHINRLRSKMEENLQFPKYILTSAGQGYQFNGNL